ncbi:MAG TPA: DUF4097 family beta strand repeat-containing protein [Pyrinomonadaceae bacterium]|jgi:hypothetical protein
MTTPLSSQVTEPVYQQPTAHQPAAAERETIRPPSIPPDKSRWPRFIPLIVLALVASALLGAFLFARLSKNAAVVVAPASKKTNAPPVKAVVNQPAQPGVALMSEEGATITKDQTVISGTYPLGDNAGVSLSNVTGRIKIEGWDEPQAEVRVIKEGGTAQDRQAVEIKLTSGKELLSLETSPTRSSPVEVHYELKLPRQVRRLEIKSADSEVELSKISSAITVTVQGSSIELSDVGGSVNTKIVQGETKVTLNGSLTGPQALKSVNGDIELRLTASVNADINAETIDGEIEVDDGLNLKVEQRQVGKSVSGRIGSGGIPITIKTVNGDIRISK